MFRYFCYNCLIFKIILVYRSCDLMLLASSFVKVCSIFRCTDILDVKCCVHDLENQIVMYFMRRN